MPAQKCPPVVACTENIVLLSLLSEVPGDPHVNPKTRTFTEASSRGFSFERELSLSDSIALIAGISGHANHVVASCIEELPNQAGMRILLAINKDKPESGDDVLHCIRLGLQNIFSLLAHSRDAGGTVQERVFDAVIAMCRDRLLDRLGYQGGATFLAGPLQQVLVALEHHHPQKESASVQLVVKRGSALMSLLRQHKPNTEFPIPTAHIKRVITAASCLADTADFTKVIDGIEPGTLNPTTQSGITHRLKKLASYQKSARQLVIQSMKSPSIFGNVTVVAVSLCPSLFSRSPEIPSESQLLACLQRCGSSKAHIGAICNVVGENQFVSKIKSVVKKSKFHAELQLIAYLELHPSAIKPRVISSSKAACYLCNLFIQLHGKYHVHRTHGKAQRLRS
jgi:hypothetical protein